MVPGFLEAVKSGQFPFLSSPKAAPDTMAKRSAKSKFVRDVGKALVRAAATARLTARRYGTPIYVWENGKVVAKDP